MMSGDFKHFAEAPEHLRQLEVANAQQSRSAGWGRTWVALLLTVQRKMERQQIAKGDADRDCDAQNGVAADQALQGPHQFGWPAPG